MDIENQKPRARSLGKWLKWKHRRDDPFHLTEVSGQLLLLFMAINCYYISKYILNFLTDGGEGQSDDYLDNVLVRSTENDPCISINESRQDFVIFWSKLRNKTRNDDYCFGF